MKKSPVTIVTRRPFPFSAEHVFDAWLNPHFAEKFLFTTSTSKVTRCEIDARVDGKFVIVDCRENGLEILHRGIYQEITRPRRLAFTLQVPQFAPEEDLVTVEITPADSGCEVAIKAETDPSVFKVVSKEDIQSGWSMILDSLARELAQQSCPFSITRPPGQR